MFSVWGSRDSQKCNHGVKSSQREGGEKLSGIGKRKNKINAVLCKSFGILQINVTIFCPTMSDILPNHLYQKEHHYEKGTATVKTHI